MTDPVLILTMKWGTLYGPEDVNRLARQVRHHLRRPHRFICFTDDGAGIGEGVETRPLPELRLPDGSGDTRWRKLAPWGSPSSGSGNASTCGSRPAASSVKQMNRCGRSRCRRTCAASRFTSALL